MLNIVTKGEFAKQANISPGRVSQLIAEGKLADCLVGEGRNAKIDADKAREKLKLRLDPSQRMGNGASTHLGASDEIDRKLKEAKLAQTEAQTRRLKEEERARAGIYVRKEHVLAETAQLVNTILQAFEGGLTDVAAEMASAFQLPTRDVTHMMRKQLRKVRAGVAQKLALGASDLPATIEETDDR